MIRFHTLIFLRFWLALIFCISCVPAWAADVKGQLRRPPSTAPAVLCSDRHIDGLGNKLVPLQETSKTLRELGAMPVPKELGYEETKAAYGYAAWLRKASDDIDRLIAEGRRLLRECRRSQSAGEAPLAANQMQEMQQAFDSQYLALQNRIAQENRQFSMVSNIMKNRHDTAKNSINNIR